MADQVFKSPEELTVGGSVALDPTATVDTSYFRDTSSITPTTNIISDLIIESQVYKSARDLFSSDPQYGTPYLSQLEMIPYSTDITDRNWWDDFSEAFGATSKFEKAYTDAFNNAMDEIRTLVSNYYTFINGLPETQIEQQKAAGYNAALTGQGVGPSSMDTSSSILPNTPQSEYSNSQISQGVTSFVEFIGSVASLASGGINSASILGMLDLAEREGYNKQQTHDLIMSQLGISPNSPYSVVSPSSSVVQDNVIKAKSDAKVAAAESSASASALDKHLSIPLGSGKPGEQSYAIMEGRDVLDQVSMYSMITRMADIYRQNIEADSKLSFAQALSALEGEYGIMSLQKGIAEDSFNLDYFNARNGSVEGTNQTSLSTAMRAIRESESAVASFNAWLADYKYATLENWANMIVDKPSLAPFFYKAIFDFGMEDTFHHLSGGRQGIHYGLQYTNQAVDAVAGFFGGIMKNIKIPTRHTSTVQHGPKGTTYTESTTTIK